MWRSLVFSISLLALVTFTFSCNEPTPNNKPWKTFYLGGQSNMDGYGLNSELPDTLDVTFDDVYTFHGNPVGDDEMNGGVGVWSSLKPGHGAGFQATSASNEYSNRFGPELSFAAGIKQLYPKHRIAIIKYSRGGSSLDSLAKVHGQWHLDYSGANQYDHFLKTVSNAFSVNDIDGDGVNNELEMEGIIWMQGESDADELEKAALDYYFNLKRIMELQRAAFHNKMLPIVIGKISDSHKDESDHVWSYLEIVQAAQEGFVAEDENAAIVRSTTSYQYPDMWHYDSEGFIDLGIQFANSFHSLTSKNQ